MSKSSLRKRQRRSLLDSDEEEDVNPLAEKTRPSNQEKSTGKSLSEALIFASTNPQYDDILFIDLQVQYMKMVRSQHGENMLCKEIVFDIQNNFCTQHVLPRFKLGIFMN